MKLLLSMLCVLQAACAVEFTDEELLSEQELALTTAYSNDFSVDASGLGFAADKWRRVSYGSGSYYLVGEYGNYSVPVLATTWLPAMEYGTTLQTAAFFGNTITWLKADAFFANHLVFDVVDWNDFKWVRLNKTGSGMLCEIGETINGTAYKRRSRTCTTTYVSNQPVPMKAELLGNAVRFTVNNGTDVMYFTYSTAIDTTRVGMGATYRAAFDYFIAESP